MRRGYEKEVRVEAIAKRLEGTTWEEIQKWIYSKYKERPSIRQMQKWFDQYKVGRDPTDARYLAKAMEDMVKHGKVLADGASGARAIEFTSWVASQDKEGSGLDVETSIIGSLDMLESHVGRESFDKALKHYLERREEMRQYAERKSVRTGPTGPTGPSGNE